MIKIILFQTVVNDRGHTQVFGLSDNGKVYRWSYQDGAWELYIKTEVEK